MPSVTIKDPITQEKIGADSIDVGVCLNDWLVEKTEQSPQIAVELNDCPLPAAQWGYQVKHGDNIVIYIQPSGAGVLSLVFKAVVSLAVNYVAGRLFGNRFEPNNFARIDQGSAIYKPTQGNRLAGDGVIQRILGRHKYYPPLISSPFYEYQNNKLFLHILMCVGWGQYSKSDLSIGGTSVDNYGDDILHQYFEPNASVIGHDAHKNIYTSKEVGAVATGQGIELTNTYNAIGSAITSPANPDVSDGYLFKFINGNVIELYFREHDEETTTTASNWDAAYSVGDIVEVSEHVNHGRYKISAVSTNQMTVTTQEGNSVSFANSADYETASIQELDVQNGEFAGAFLATPNENETTTKITADLFFPNGIGHQNDDGSIASKTLTVEFQYKIHGSETWNSVSHSVTGATRDQQGRTVVIYDGVAIQAPLVKARLTTGQTGDALSYETLQWERLKGEMTANSSYPNVTTLAMKIEGSNAVAANAQNQISGVYQSILPVWNGSDWDAEEATSSVVSAARNVCDEVGYLSVIDDAVFQSRAAQLDARNDEFNAVVESQSTLFNTLRQILKPVFSFPVIDEDKISIVRHEPITAFGQFFSPQNWTACTETGSFHKDDEFDGVRVEYVDPDTWKSAFITCVLPNAAGNNLEEMRLFGVTSRNMAYRLGMTHLLIKRDMRVTWSINTKLEALNAQMFDKCSVPARGSQSGWITGYNRDNKQVTVPQRLVWKDGQAHYILIRGKDGQGLGQTEVTKAGDYTMQMQTDLLAGVGFSYPESSQAWLFSFGVLSDFVRYGLVNKISVEDSNSSTVELVEYADVFTYYDSNAPS